MKSRSKKILAVMTTLAIGAPIASADPAVPAPKLPAHWTERDLKILGVVSIDNQAYLVTPGAPPVLISQYDLGRYLGETEPLLGASGRPACGNTLNKAPSRCLQAIADVKREREAAVAKSGHKK